MPTEITVQQFKPSEIISILRNHLATGQVNQRVVSLRGIYFQGTYINQYFHTATDRLVDEGRRDELIRIIEHSMEKLTLAELEALYYDMTTKNFINE